MMPAMAAKLKPIVAGPISGSRRTKPTAAPTGSASPETVAHQKALALEPVASRSGTATAMPSGIL